MTLPFGIDRSTLAGGLTGLATFGIGLGLKYLGVPVPPEVITGVVTLLVPLVVHFVPDAVKEVVAKVDADIKEVSAVLPNEYSSPADFPDKPPTVTDSNLNQGG